MDESIETRQNGSSWIQSATTGPPLVETRFLQPPNHGGQTPEQPQFSQAPAQFGVDIHDTEDDGCGKDHGPWHAAPRDKDGSTRVDEVEDENVYLRGLRLWMVGILNATMLFVVQIEVSIVTTSLVAITKDLGGFDAASWVMSSYLLGYVGVVVVITKLSDIFGRKPAFALSILIFTVFSGACAAVASMPQLIIMRAFQGIGGGGSYALSAVMIIEMVPPRKYSKLVAYTGIAIVLAMVLGPIVGGAISSGTSWRWIFLFNVPVGLVGLLLALAGIPNGFPRHGQPRPAVKCTQALSRIDYPGCVVLLLATMSFTAAFQEANARFPWSSAYVIVLIVVSVVLWLLLLLWERRTTLAHGVREPVLPWRFLTSRTMVGILLGLASLGGPLTVTALQLPQRFQLVNGLSSLGASVRLVPFAGAVPLGTIASAHVSGRFRVPFVYGAVVGALLQVMGFALLGTITATTYIPAAIYGYEVLAGVGCGLCFQSFILAVPFTAEQHDKAVGLGAATQFRAMGSSVSVAVATSVFNGYVLSESKVLGIPNPGSSLITVQNKADVGAVLELGPDARRVLAQGYNRQMLFLVACGVAQVGAALLMWRKRQIVAG